MIIFLYGQDTYRSLAKLTEIRERFQREVDATGSSIETVDGDGLDLAYIRKVVLAPSLFVKNRLVVFKRVLASKPNKQLQQDIISLLSEYATDEKSNVLIFWEALDAKQINGLRGQKLLADYLLGGNFVSEFALLPLNKMRLWVEQKLKETNSTISPDALKLLLQICGDNMWQLAHVVEVLGAYRYTNQITSVDVELFVAQNTVDGDQYAVLDTIRSGNVNKALQKLEPYLVSSDGCQSIFTTLKWYINTLAQLRLAETAGVRDRSQTATALHIHPFVVQKYSVFAQQIPNDTLVQFVSRMNELDIELREKTAPPAVILTRLVYALTSIHR